MPKLPHQSTPLAVNDGDAAPLELVQFDYAMIAISEEQSGNIAVGNHIEFNQIAQRGDKISLSTGLDQENGIITLAGGATWLLQTWLGGSFSGGHVRVQWTDHSDDSPLIDDSGTVAMRMILIDDLSTDSVQTPSSGFIFTPLAQIQVKLDIVTVGSFDNFTAGCRVWIEEIG